MGQGAVGIECRLDDRRTRELLAPLNHDETAIRVKAERAMNTRLEGVPVPIGSYAELINGELWLRALVGAPDGSQMVRGERRGKPQDAEQLGVSLAEELLDNGAREILADVYDGEPLHEYSRHPPFSRRRAVSEPSARTGAGGRSFPLIEFSPGRELSALADHMNTLQEGDLLFALSQHAVEFAHAQLQQQGLNWPTAPRYFAIGRSTAGAAYRQWSRRTLPVRSGNQRSLATIT